MGYQVLYHRNINKDLKKLDKKIVDLFFSAVKERILKDPYIGVRLKGRYRNLWKYRISDFRIIYSINKDEIRIHILRIRHRNNVYDNIYF
ncbi:type II toxin-antitoxin system RelE/ParE family toxin [Actinomycetota bacterium]